MRDTWRFEATGVDGQCRVFGVNIFDCEWEATGERVLVRDPLYGQDHVFCVYRAQIGGEKRRFAAGEFSNCVWGFYTEPASGPI